MRVKVWIAGTEGPAWDFEMVQPPRVGEGVSISTERGIEDGIVSNVMWQLVAVDRSGNALTHGVEPVGAVTMVHVICRPPEAGPSVLSDQVANDLALAWEAAAGRGDL